MLRNASYFKTWVPGQAALHRNTVFWVLGDGDATTPPALLAAVVFDWSDSLRVSDFIVDAARVHTSDARRAVLLACSRYALISGAFADNPRCPPRVSAVGSNAGAEAASSARTESLIVPLGLAGLVGLDLAEAFGAAGRDVGELEDSAWMYR